MRVGFIADAHSDVLALTAVLAALRLEGVDQVVSLGDALECHLPKGYDGPPVRLEEATSVAEDVASLLSDVVLVRGNQEERIREATRPEDVSAAVSWLLKAPVSGTMATLAYTHGHEFDWMQVGVDHWQPRWPVVETSTVVHGHHHRSSLTALVGAADTRLDRTPPPGVTVELRADERYLLNVGPAQAGSLAWAVVDDERRTVMLQYQQARPRRAGS